MKNKIRTIFIGTPEFSVPALTALIKDEYFDIISIITQKDKKAGRKQVITPPPVKIKGEEYKIPVLQPEKIKDLTLTIENLNPDIIVLVAYAQIIPEEILNIPKYGVINIHGSLLPKYRGASCVQAAILEGDKQTGITIMKMDKGLDTGPILAQEIIDILPDDTTASLFKKLSDAGAKILPNILKEYIAGNIEPQAQDEGKSSYVGLLKKEDGKINWEEEAVKIERFIRTMRPWPGAWTKLGEKKLKILEVENSFVAINKYKIGELFLDNKNLAVQCGKNALVIKKLQLEGKKDMSVKEFLQGHESLIRSTILG